DLEFVSAVSAENEFELKKDRIGVATGQEKRVIDKVVIVLQTDLGKFGRVPCQVRGDARPGLSIHVIGKSRILGVVVITANSGDPPFLESPEHLRVESPIVKRFRDWKRFIHAAAPFQPAIHEFRLPLHEWETTFGVRAFPFVEEVAAINLRARISAGLVRSKGAGHACEHNLSRAKIDRIFPARDPDEVLQAAQFAIGCSAIEKHSTVAWIAK